MQITKENIKDLIRKNFESERTHTTGSWHSDQLQKKDLDDLLHFYRNSFERGLMERPKKNTLLKPYPFSGKFYPGWFIKEYLKGKITAGKRKAMFRRDFHLLTASGITFPVFNPVHDGLYYDFDGKSFSAEMRKYAAFCAFIALRGKRAEHVCEIGGGFGGMCEMMALNQHFKKYLIIDLFETLGVSMTYLLNCPTVAEYKLIYVESPDDFNNLPDKCILFVSYETFKKIKNEMKQFPLGLFINSYSFVEMGSKTIREYFDFIQSYDTTQLFSVNSIKRSEGNEVLSAYHFPYDEHWTHAHEVLNAHGHNELSRLSYRSRHSGSV